MPEVEEEDEEEEEEGLEVAGSGEEHQQFTVMLNALKGKYLPHGLHCVRISPGVTLLIVKEVGVLIAHSVIYSDL
jgi:hypothetical protein